MKEFQFIPHQDYMMRENDNTNASDEEVATESFGIDFFAIVMISIIIFICIVVYALYHVANYAHSRDTTFGQSTVARITVIIGVIFSFVSCTYVPIDVELKTRGDSASTVSRWFWIAIVFSQLFYIWAVCPMLFAFYETDEKDSFCKRLKEAFRLQLPLFITLVVLLVPTYFFASKVVIPNDVA